MASPFTAGLADVTVTVDGESTTFTGIKVLVRPEHDVSRGRLSAANNTVIAEMDVASTRALGGRRFEITGSDGEVWSVVTRCAPCGR